jgi:hypothetical protein
MPNPQIATRVPPEAVERLDRLAAVLTSQALPGAAPTERSDAARVCILVGLEVMEKRVAAKRAPAKGKTSPKRKPSSDLIDPNPPNPHRAGKASPKRKGKASSPHRKSKT